jgi:hypothetical protein
LLHCCNLICISQALILYSNGLGMHPQPHLSLSSNPLLGSFLSAAFMKLAIYPTPTCNTHSQNNSHTPFGQECENWEEVRTAPIQPTTHPMIQFYTHVIRGKKNLLNKGLITSCKCWQWRPSLNKTMRIGNLHIWTL